MRPFDFTRAIVRAPGASVVRGLRAGGQDDPTHEGVLAEHVAYAAALEAAGVAVDRLPALEDFPDSVFVEDPALVFCEGAILLRPGAPSRIGEADTLAPILADRFDRLLRVEQGHADGGDILVTPGMVHIGLSARTDRAGAGELAGLLAALGHASRIVQPPAGTLHLKTGCTLIDEETILATRAVASSMLFADFRMLIVPEGEEAAANALRVNQVVLAGAGFPRTIDLLDRHGLAVVPLATAEIGRIDAGLSCMSLRWHG
jgi:dimethylargininase